MWAHTSQRERPALSGVLVPLPNRASRHDNGQLTLGEHHFSLSHGVVGSVGPAEVAFRRGGGKSFAAARCAGAYTGTVTNNGTHLAIAPSPLASPSPSPSPSPSDIGTFQLYANPADNPNRPLSEAESTSHPLLHRLAHAITNNLTTLSNIKPQFVPFSSNINHTNAAPAAAAARPSDADDAVLHSLDAHPNQPFLSVLVKDQIHFYDVYGSSSTNHAVPSSSSSDRSGVVTGEWLPRVLRHPLMSGTRSMRFTPIGGNLIACGTASGTICIWQLNTVSSSGSSGSSASNGAKSGKRQGAWLFVLQDAHHHKKPIDSLEFSPNGRWLVSGSSQSNTILLWEVTSALSGLSTATPIKKFLSPLIESNHGVSLLRWSPDGTRLAVCSAPMSQEGGIWRSAVGSVATMIDSGVKKVWKKIHNTSESEKTTTLIDPTLQPPSSNDDATVASPSPTNSDGVALPSGTLTIWRTSDWSHSSWSTLTPIETLAWAPSSITGDEACISSDMVLLGLAGSSILESLSVSGEDRRTALSNASIRLNLSQTHGLPTSRLPTDPMADGIEEFLVGGRIREIVVSPTGRRLVVRFVGDQPGAELLALFAMQPDQTRTWQILPIGMIRGPVCPCQGTRHATQTQADSTRTRLNDELLDAASSDGTETKVYPSLLPSPSCVGVTCRELNLPVSATFLHGHSHDGELLAIGYKFGSIHFIPLYFEETT